MDIFESKLAKPMLIEEMRDAFDSPDYIYELKLNTKGDEEITWIVPNLVCTVQFMMKTETGNLRQPVYWGLRNDKAPHECIDSG